MCEGRAEEEGEKGTHYIGKEEGDYNVVGGGLHEEVTFVVEDLDTDNLDAQNVKWCKGFGNENRADTHRGPVVAEDRQDAHPHLEVGKRVVHPSLEVNTDYIHRVGCRGMEMEEGNCVGYPFAQQFYFYIRKAKITISIKENSNRVHIHQKGLSL